MTTITQEAREIVSHPGKFEGEHPMIPILWDIYMAGGADEETEQLVRIGRWLLEETEQGFVIGARYDSVAQAQAVLQAKPKGE